MGTTLNDKNGRIIISESGLDINNIANYWDDRLKSEKYESKTKENRKNVKIQT